MKLPTASSLHRALKCPASVSLPKAPSESSEAAERGTAIHDWVARSLLGQILPPPAEYADTCEGLDLAALLGGRELVQVEAAYALDALTGRARFLGSMIGREYPALGPTHLTGTADLILRDSEGRFWVSDLKTGAAQNVERARVNPQLAFLALALCRLYGLEEVGVELIFLHEDGGIHTDRAVLDSLDLDAFAAELRAALARWEAPQPEVRPGEWCKWCPAFSACPAQNQLARSFASSLGLISERVAAMSPAEKGRAFVELRRLLALGEAVEKQLKQDAHRVPLELPDGTRLGYVEQERRSIDAAVAEAVLVERFGPEAAREALEQKTSQEAIRRVTKGKRGAFPEIMREIEARGGVKVSKWEKLAELPAALEGGE